MKTVKLSGLMGEIEIPEAYGVVRNGVTQKNDQVCSDAAFKLFTKVKAGGIPVSRYNAVIRPISKVSHAWSRTRKFESDTPAPKAKIKKGKKK